ncbi:MAG: leucine-rich repeat protein, partial [Metamycoplasmataceae bacterium]
ISMLESLKGSNPTTAKYGFTQTQWNSINWRAIQPFTGTTLTRAAVNAIGWNIQTNITLADWNNLAPNVTAIAAEAFDGLSLVIITIPDRITTIGDNAFRNTNSLLGNNVSMLESLQGTNPTVPKYGFTQTQWNLINWIARQPFQGTTLNRAAINSIGWDTRTNISLADWNNLAPNVTAIDAGAFEGLSSLVAITIPDKVITIGNNAFANTSSLLGSNVSMLELLKGINPTVPKYGFTQTQWDSINWRVIPPFTGTTLTRAAINSIGWNIQSNITLADWNTLAPNVTAIDAGAFDGLSSLATITIPDRITTIGNNAFRNTTSLLGSSVSMFELLQGANPTVAKYGFTQTQWDSINWRSVPPFTGTTLTRADINSIGWNIKTNITLADWNTLAPNVTAIAAGAFDGLLTLATITIPDKVTTIGENAFRNTTSLLGSSVSMFESLQGVNPTVPKYGFTQTQWNSINWRTRQPFLGTTLTRTAINSIGWDTRTNITLSDWNNFAPNVTIIDAGAFQGLSTLATISIPDKVTTIGNNAFANTTSLLGSSVSMLDSLKGSNPTVAKYGFTQIQWNSINWRTRQPFLGTTLTRTAITSIGWDTQTNITLADWNTLAPNVTIIDAGAFDSLPLLAIAIPERITAIGNNAFRNTNSLLGSSVSMFESLKGVNPTVAKYGFTQTQWNTINWITRQPFEGTTLTRTAINSIGWDTQPTITLADWNTLAPNVIIIDATAFEGLPLTSIFIPDKVTAIGNNAFRNTTALLGNNVSMLDSLKGSNPTVAKYGFTQIQWNSINWRSIPPFEGTTLTRAAINSIGWDTKTNITLDDWNTLAPNVTIIDAAAFDGLPLVSITIPDKVTAIGNNAFRNTTSLLGSNVSMLELLKGVNPTVAKYGFTQNQWNSINWRAVAPFEGTTLTRAAINSIGWDTQTNITLTDWNTLAPNVTIIDAAAFDGLSLVAITIPDRVTAIGNNAFRNTTSLLGSSVSMFESLKGVNPTVAKYGFTQTQWNSITWRSIPSFEGTTLTRSVINSIGWDTKTNITLADWNNLAPNVTIIDASAFEGLPLVAITIPDRITAIGNNAFRNTTSLLGSSVSMFETLKGVNPAVAKYGFTQTQWNSINWRSIPPFEGTTLTRSAINALRWDTQTIITLADWNA